MKAILLLLLSVSALFAGVEEDWAVIISMDAGPAHKPTHIEEARDLAKVHFARHSALIEKFLEENPNDPRAFDAHLRLAAIQAAVGKMESRQSLLDESMRLLQTLEKDKSKTLSQRAEAGFRRVSLLMQSLKGQESDRRRDLVAAVRNYSIRYSSDRRAPRLLVEVATICDNDPSLKRQLLEEALQSSRDEALNRRIEDDLRRLNLLEKPLALKFPTVQGEVFDLVKQRGRIVVLVFWSAEAAPSLLWMEDFRRALVNLPTGLIEVATVNLDKNPDRVSPFLKEVSLPDWPTACDGKGWSGALVREFGINALPTVFLFDQRGILRVVNARNSYETWIRKLIAQPNAS
jgi:hypothetical protein